MTIPFKQIPGNIRVPLFYAEVDGSQANTATLNQRALIVGQITAAGTALPNVPIISQGVSDAMVAGGQDSMLALMTATYRLNDTFGEVWYLPLADDPSAVAASGTVAFTAAATANGTAYLYVAGVRYALPVLTTQTTAQLATALAALINADLGCPVNATVTTNTVTLTAVNKGPAGNDIDLRLNYQGTRGGEVLPAGLAVTIAAMASGATPPSLTTAFGNLSTLPFDFIACPYTDTTSLDAFKVLLNDVTGRWSWSVQIYGHFMAAYRGTLGAQTTLGVTRNDQHGSIMGFNDSPTPSWLWAAAMAGAIAVSVRADPATPVQTIALQGVLAPPLQSRFLLTDRNTMLYDGISTFFVGDDGTVYLENVITTYQKNAFGSPDNSYLEIETMYTLAYVLRALKSVVTTKYARVKLAANGTRFAAGSNVVTPNVIRADLIAQYRQLESQGLVQNGQAFKDALIVQQNATNPNRVDVLYPSTLINQLRIFALLAQFRLQ
ncbi:phage tail sheath subtilisin-like domain-containing protein [Janthinobacterium sp.]|uniref:phage tail sheath subtilisin-like domain-containing protein n=1 Tax=Janthinobacterium sp. TaxID=1871054 RepID=UPI00293D7391|nr:phage tail sheath subtilisin-like domain-containing protein [Janthinobacterium sp.]